MRDGRHCLRGVLTERPQRPTIDIPLTLPDDVNSVDGIPSAWSVRILWGKCPEEGDVPKDYHFRSQAELEAFLQGVDEANGWFDYRVIDPGSHYCFEENNLVGSTSEDCPSCSKGESE